ncbi:MAG: adenylyltransferase/cytidyltransferase family protein [Patescibacteria group bacterium]|nr:adenylyltransferase/cytidyltransferase family protein [Patescibacteria group bacterium]
MGKKDEIFGNGVDFSSRFVSDYEKLSEMADDWKKQGVKVVLTSGSFDLLHIGHAQYLTEAKKRGDILVVGIDDDEKTKARKGSNRPVVPENERFRMLAYLRPVDVIVPKGLGQPSLHLLKTVRPDVLIISETTNHSDKRIKNMEWFCGEIKMLPPQATTSTSAKIRKLFTQGVSDFAEKATKAINGLLREMTT